MSGVRRILIADDDSDVREVLERFFSERGHEVCGVEDGRQALAMLRTWEPHIVLLDLEMPRMSGLDVLRHIRVHHDDTPVLAFSGHSAAEKIADDALRLGAVRFFTKPLDFDALEELVAAITGQSAA